MVAHNRPRSRITLYWLVWLGSVACLLLARFTTFLGVRGEDIRFPLGACHAFLTLIAIVILTVVELRRLTQYVRHHHPEKWKEVMYSPFFGPGFGNTLRLASLYFSKDDLGDPVVADLKLNYRRYLTFAFGAWVTTVLLYAVVCWRWGN